jgi:MFS family permease
MCAALLLNMVGFSNYGAVLPGIIHDLALTPSEAGFAGGIFFLSYAIGSPIASVLTDVFDPRRLYLAGCAAGLAGGICFPLLSDSYGALLAGRLLSGFGMAGTFIPGMTLLGAAVPPAERARAVALYTSCLTLGTSGSFASAAILRMAGGWPFAFLGAALACALAAGAVGLGMAGRRGGGVSLAALFANLRLVLRTRAVLLYAIAGAGNAWEGMAFRVWWIALLAFCASRTREPWADLVDFALLSAIAGPLAMPVSAWVAARAEAAARTGKRERVIAAAACSSVLAGALLIFNLDAPLWLVFALTLLYQSTIFSDASSLPVGIMSQAPASARGAVLAVQVTMTNSGSFIGAWVCGIVLAQTGGTASLAAWRWTLGAMMAASAVSAVAMLAVKRR